jgi:hypothetical protein
MNFPPIEGARILTLAKPRTRRILNYGQENFVYETRLLLFPEQSGVLLIPEITISGAIETDARETVEFTNVSPEKRLPVKPIAPDYNAQWWLVAVADNVSITQTWSKPVDTFRSGDIVRRDITLTIDGVTSEQLPEIVQERNAGYAVIGSDSSRRTRLTADSAVTELHQGWDLRIETTEVFYISPIRLNYWDPAAAKMVSAGLPAQRIEPLPPDAAALQAQLMNAAISTHWNRRLGLLAALSLPLLVFLVLLSAALYQWLPTRADRRLLRACKTAATPAGCYRALSSWSRASFGEDLQRSADAAHCLGDHASTQLVMLQRALFAASTIPPEPRQLASALIRAARRLRLQGLRYGIMNFIKSLY